MNDDKKSRRDMYKTIILSTFKSMGLAFIALGVLLLIFRHEFTISTPTLVIGLIGTIMIFIGGSLTSDALGRYDSVGLPHYRYGALLQSLGLGFTIFALIVK